MGKGQSFQKNGVSKTGCPHAKKKKKLDPYITLHKKKMSSEQIKDLKIRHEIIYFVEEYRRGVSMVLFLTVNFLDTTPKTQATKAKINKRGLHQTKILYHKENNKQSEVLQNGKNYLQATNPVGINSQNI